MQPGGFKMVDMQFAKSLHNKTFYSVGPAGAIAGSMIDMITVSCERNLLNGKFSDWVVEPNIDRHTQITCVR